jgi:hypothetical protein
VGSNPTSTATELQKRLNTRCGYAPDFKVSSLSFRLKLVSVSRGLRGGLGADRATLGRSRRRTPASLMTAITSATTQLAAFTVVRAGSGLCSQGWLANPAGSVGVLRWPSEDSPRLPDFGVGVGEAMRTPANRAPPPRHCQPGTAVYGVLVPAAGVVMPSQASDLAGPRGCRGRWTSPPRREVSEIWPLASRNCPELASLVTRKGSPGRAALRLICRSGRPNICGYMTARASRSFGRSALRRCTLVPNSGSRKGAHWRILMRC